MDGCFTVDDVTLEVSADDALRTAVAVLAANQRVEAKGEGQARVAEGASDARRTHALTTALVTQTTRAVARCETNTMPKLHFI